MIVKKYFHDALRHYCGGGCYFHNDAPCGVYDAELYLVTVHNDVAEMPAPPQGFVAFSTIV